MLGVRMGVCVEMRGQMAKWEAREPDRLFRSKVQVLLTQSGRN